MESSLHNVSRWKVWWHNYWTFLFFIAAYGLLVRSFVAFPTNHGVYILFLGFMMLLMSLAVSPTPPRFLRRIQGSLGIIFLALSSIFPPATSDDNSQRVLVLNGEPRHGWVIASPIFQQFRWITTVYSISRSHRLITHDGATVDVSATIEIRLPEDDKTLRTWAAKWNDPTGEIWQQLQQASDKAVDDTIASLDLADISKVDLWFLIFDSLDKVVDSDGVINGATWRGKHITVQLKLLS